MTVVKNAPPKPETGQGRFLQIAVADLKPSPENAELYRPVLDTAPAVLLFDAGDADAALLLDGRGLATLRPHDRRGLLLLTLAAERGRA